jgi:DNA repair exonuclease SbcCD ATPase subunit
VVGVGERVGHNEPGLVVAETLHVQQLTQQLSSLRSRQLQLPPYDEAAAKQVNANLEWWEQTRIEKARQETQLCNARAALEHMRRQLEEAEETARKAEATKKWRARVEGMAALVHKDAAPRFVAQQWLMRLQHDMNDVLRTFDTDFTVAADEGLSFTVQFTDGRVQPADRLSSGQKVVLAMAFRLSLNLLLAGQIGAMYLDEPTAYLDAQHSCFEGLCLLTRQDNSFFSLLFSSHVINLRFLSSALFLHRAEHSLLLLETVKFVRVRLAK